MRKKFIIAYAPILQEDVDNPSKYHSIMTLEFLDDNVISNTSNQMKGRYELTEDALMVQFETETENLKVYFGDFKASEIDFSAYSALVSDLEFEIKDEDQVSHLKSLAYVLSDKKPLEFLEKE